MLFSADFYPTAEEAKAQLEQYLEAPEEEVEDSQGILQILHKVDLDPENAAYLQERAAAIIDKIPELDHAIDQAAAGWKTRRMGEVELTILRQALYERQLDSAVPEKVAVNEAVELVKKYGDENDYQFVNGLLGTVAREHGLTDTMDAEPASC